ncbi:hypothetical protein OQA88_11520 [Cercophora sp. LCS_1]
MEVSLVGLPPDLTDRSLQSQLNPVLERLEITHYVCRVHKNKKNGHIVFLSPDDGTKFLNHHGTNLPPGATRGPRHRGSREGSFQTQPPRLTLMNQPVTCRRNFRSVLEFELKNIEYEVKKRQRKPRPEISQSGSVRLVAQELGCGHFTFVDGVRFTFVSEWAHRGQVVVKFTKRNVLLSFDSDSGITEARIPHTTIHEMVWKASGKVALILTSPPEFLVRASNSKSTRSPGPSASRRPALDGSHGKIASHCTVYYISVPLNIVGRSDSVDFLTAMGRIRSADCFHVTQFDFDHQVAGSPGCALPRFVDAIATLQTQLKDYTTKVELPFEVLFILEALVANGYLHPTVVSDLARKLHAAFQKSKKTGKKQFPFSLEALKKLFQGIEYPSPYADTENFEASSIMDYLEQKEKELANELELRDQISGNTENMVKIFRAIVTPTRITLHGPELEAKNRVLRKFPQHLDYFVRAQVCDENGQDLFFNPTISLDIIYSRFKSVLNKGIQIAGRLYQFLGFSHSSLRAHSVWLSAPFVYKGKPEFPKSIIDGLGRFETIKSPARRAARIGQAFSETPFELPLDDCEIAVAKIPDIERNDRVFSDGVGTISAKAIEEIWSRLPQTRGNSTCFQIRWAGAKGILSLDPSLMGRRICIRPSMDKFESNDKRLLEICDVASKGIPMVLNRQLVKILEDMRAPESWFFDLQTQELQRLRGITHTVSNSAYFLKSQSIGESIRLPSLLREAERMGADYRRDPFLRSAIEAAVLRELRLLKHKARIPVEKGVTLFGVIDETGFLKEGEVYVTFDAIRGRKGQPPGPGQVLVTRSPALHPGDIQLAHNVVPPANHNLSKLKNCIAFSQHGARDLPSQLSGGDLDGDLFHVIWDPDVVDFVETFSPADYPRVEPLTLGVPVEAHHMADFFIEFMKADHLGVIATRHMIVADKKEDGTDDADCLKLAELHSSAVDFSKSGVPVEMTDLPKTDPARPDFLAPGPWVKIRDRADLEMDNFIAQDEDEDEDAEGPRHKYYESKKLLGKLYRAVEEDKIWNEEVKLVINGAEDFWEKLIPALQDRVAEIGDVDWQRRVSDAESLRHVYDDKVLELMSQWSDHPTQPLTELEVFVGFVLNKTGSQTNRQRDRSMKLKDEYDRLAARIMKNMRSAQGAPLKDIMSNMELCLAGIYLGSPKRRAGNNPVARRSPDECQSFRVLATSALLSELRMADAAVERLKASSGGFVGVNGASRHLNRARMESSTKPSSKPSTEASAESSKKPPAKASTKAPEQSSGPLQDLTNGRMASMDLPVRGYTMSPLGGYVPSGEGVRR